MGRTSTVSSLLQSKAIVGLALVVILFVLFGLLAASYTLFIAAVAGIALALLILLLARVLSRRQRIALLVIVSVLALLFLAFMLRSGTETYPSAIVASVPAYTVTIRPGSELGAFVVSEEADVAVEDFASPAPQATRVKQTESIVAQSKGLFLHEVTITPLSDLRVSLPDGTRVTPMLLTDMDSRLVVKLQDLPKGSFYAARHALGLTAHPYLDTETLTWSPTDLGEAITFAYIPSPAHHLRPLLGPFLTVSSVSQWVVGAIVALMTALFGTFVQPALMQKLKTALLPWLPARMSDQKPGSPPSSPAA